MEKLDKSLIADLKSVILQSRYIAARLVNRELIVLYLKIGSKISIQTKKQAWGSKVIEQISNELQNELPGLKGFSAPNLRKMTLFYNFWSKELVICSTLSNKLESTNIELIGKFFENRYKENIEFGPTLSNQLEETFFSISFSNHFLIVTNSKSKEEALFYIQKSSIEDTDNEDEKLIENEIVRNIKKFILTLGSGFAFIGNQYRLIVEEQEFFVDLLFFNRKLQSLVAIDLKRGKFKPEYLGKMNFYLSALDDLVKQPHENPSIGIILCKEKNNKIVEYSFRDFNKAMGVATYKTSNKIPDQFKGLLPDSETLKTIMD